MSQTKYQKGDHTDLNPPASRATGYISSNWHSESALSIFERLRKHGETDPNFFCVNEEETGDLSDGDDKGGGAGKI